MNTHTAAAATAAQVIIVGISWIWSQPCDKWQNIQTIAYNNKKTKTISNEMICTTTTTVVQSASAQITLEMAKESVQNHFDFMAMERK